MPVKNMDTRQKGLDRERSYALNYRSVGEIAASLAIVAVTALLLLWVTARVFRAKILLSGQRITDRNVWIALRYAD